MDSIDVAQKLQKHVGIKTNDIMRRFDGLRTRLWDIASAK